MDLKEAISKVEFQLAFLLAEIQTDVDLRENYEGSQVHKGRVRHANALSIVIAAAKSVANTKTNQETKVSS